MLAATCVTIRGVSLDGLKPVWKVTDPKDVVAHGEQIFIKVNTVSSSLWSLVGVNNPNATDVSTRSLAANIGLKSLIDKRNKAQSEALDASANVSACSLFGQEAKKRFAGRTRNEITQMRTSASESLEIVISIDGRDEAINVLRPVHPADSLFVEYDERSIAIVLKVLRDSLYTENKRRRTTHLPKGVHVRAQGIYQYSVAYDYPDGTVKQKLFVELEDALAFNADPEKGAAIEAIEDGVEHEAIEDGVVNDEASSSAAVPS